MNRYLLFNARFLNRVITTFNYQRSLTSSSFDNILKDVNKYRKHTESDGYVWNSIYGPIEAPNTTIDQYIWGNSEKWKNHVAVECGVTGRKYTYADLRDRCAALTINLREKLGLKHNDIIAICLPNCPGKYDFSIELLKILLFESINFFSFMHRIRNRLIGFD